MPLQPNALLLGLSLLAASGCAETNKPNTAEPKQTHILTLTTPSAGWSLECTGAYQAKDAVLCVYRLSSPEGMAAQIISEVSCSIRLPASERPIRDIVLGKTWNWETNPGVHFPESEKATDAQLENTKPLRFEVIP